MEFCAVVSNVKGHKKQGHANDLYMQSGVMEYWLLIDKRSLLYVFDSGYN